MRGVWNSTTGLIKACGIEGDGGGVLVHVPGIEAHCHSGRGGQIGEEALVETLAADESHGRFGAFDGADGKEAESGATVWKLFAFEECIVVGDEGRGLWIAEARGPLRRADDIAIGANDLEELELRELGHGLRFFEIRP